MTGVVAMNRIPLLTFAAVALFALAFVVGIFIPHHSVLGLIIALDLSDALRLLAPYLATAVLIAVLAETVRGWRRRHPDFRWALLAGGVSVAGYGIFRGLQASFSGV
jgi:hypothetical protein